ncbi:hypothetical protein CMV_023990 [Castanea mollissima]|uniref:Uncharacterized protein n=1 Tax=Castanea mollissima TaxID=60419 RepID=A0A8J4QPG3_9ROSI|nr:hypothetical protein CMV_023990 [Castanea mollissima]
MGLHKLPLVVLLFLVFSLLSFIALCDDSELTVKFLKTPHAFSNLNSTVFVFKVHVGGNRACTNCNLGCKLDDGFVRINASQCENGTIFSYKWTVDTVPPTANITASTPFTNASTVSINISFSETCTGGGGFVCSSVSNCSNFCTDSAGNKFERNKYSNFTLHFDRRSIT